eukprot:TRINITY_DN1126_c0_g1_i1.p1 TRINITY_DN1126_c0_g1~~TRINITY_DN1126_c0_g1_i1.p1  ORF type:complete len:284 (+),score=-33.85 TRINITY_DN1126_c0_g1_i1:99-950(+)
MLVFKSFCQHTKNFLLFHQFLQICILTPFQKINPQMIFINFILCTKLSNYYQAIKIIFLIQNKKYQININQKQIILIQIQNQTRISILSKLFPQLRYENIQFQKILSRTKTFNISLNYKFNYQSKSQKNIKNRECKICNQKFLYYYYYFDSLYTLSKHPENFSHLESILNIQLTRNINSQIHSLISIFAIILAKDLTQNTTIILWKILLLKNDKILQFMYFMDHYFQMILLDPRQSEQYLSSRFPTDPLQYEQYLSRIFKPFRPIKLFALSIIHIKLFGFLKQ